MDQAEKARVFAKLHAKGAPLLLYNIWDAGSARAVEAAGAKALATGSWSVAAAQGYPDGEAIPIDLVESIVKGITAATPLPVSIDFEGGYAADPADVARNVKRIVEAGAIGVNFEDQAVGAEGLYEIAAQCERLQGLRTAGNGLDIPLFINARTDLFLKAKDPADHSALMGQALARAEAYGAAGANGFFVPGLVDSALIAEICDATALPVNVMVMKNTLSITRLKELGVSRISHGPGPYVALMGDLTERARSVFASDNA